jgi:hypothetical protein
MPTGIPPVTSFYGFGQAVAAPIDPDAIGGSGTIRRRFIGDPAARPAASRC